MVMQVTHYIIVPRHCRLCRYLSHFCYSVSYFEWHGEKSHTQQTCTMSFQQHEPTNQRHRYDGVLFYKHLCAYFVR